MTTEAVIKAIQNQTSQSPAYLVYVIEIVSIKFDTFTPQLVNLLESYQNLQMLTLNDCGIKSLQNFPNLPGLIRLDLVFNEIKGEDLVHLRNSRHLQTIMLGGNKVQKLQNLQHLSRMTKLFQLDFINNPIQKQPGYRVKVFQMFPSLMVLDTLDKSGKDAYNSTSMIQTASRVPDTLFDKSPIIPVTAPIITAPIVANTKSLFKVSKAPNKKSISKIINNPAKMNVDPPKSAKIGRNIGKGKASMAATNSHTRSSRAGLVFPVTRIKRHLHGLMINNRVSVVSAIYLAAVLQYLTAQLVQIAGNVAKNNKKVRITPKMIKQAIQKDEEIKKLLTSVTIPLQQ